MSASITVPSERSGGRGGHWLSQAIRSGRRSGQLFSYAILSVLVIVALYPILTLIMKALKTRAEITVNPLGMPQVVYFGNFAAASVAGGYAQAFTNSIVITVGTVLGLVTISTLAAYALARLQVRGADALMMYLIIANTIPAQLFLVPLFFMWNALGLVNNPLGVILIYWARYAPFHIFLLRSFFVGLSRDFEDAARIDGASELQVLTQVVVPLSRPALMSSALISGMWAWNEFLFAVVFLNSRPYQTAALRYVAFISEYNDNWALTGAAGILVVLPIVILFLLLQERFIQGMAAGGLKG